MEDGVAQRPDAPRGMSGRDEQNDDGCAQAASEPTPPMKSCSVIVIFLLEASVPTPDPN